MRAGHIFVTNEALMIMLGERLGIDPKEMQITFVEQMTNNIKITLVGSDERFPTLDPNRENIAPVQVKFNGSEWEIIVDPE